MRAVPVLLLVLLAACDTGGTEARRAFETQALFGLSDGPTADDWQPAPGGPVSLQVLQPAQPNPARRDDVVSVQVSATSAPGGFVLRVRNARGGFDGGRLGGDLPGPGPIYTFTFFASEAATAAGQARGSVRLVLFDGFDRVVTYGDLVLTD